MGPPYAPKTAAIGGVPTIGVDVAICSVFLVLFMIGAAGHMTILQLNLRKGHKFLMSGLMFGFCMARIVTQIMRIVWACYPEDVSVAIAAMIFVSAGVLILFLINLIFAQRIIRAAHPHFGWHRAMHYGFMIMYILILLMLILVITATVDSFYTLNTNIKRIDADLQRTTSTYFMAVSFAPIPMVILGLVVPRKTRLEKFGRGRWRTKIWILLTSSVLLCLGASFRLGTLFKNPRPRADPAWYHAKWCFYLFNFTLEIIVVYLYLILRIDQRFHVPDNSHRPGDYSGENSEKQQEETGRRSSTRRIMSEEEVFDDQVTSEDFGAKDEERRMRSEGSTLHSPVSA
jgi:hypothetical protein